MIEFARAVSEIVVAIALGLVLTYRYFLLRAAIARRGLRPR